MLRLALTHLQKLTKKGSLHPAPHTTRCGALIPLGGLAVCGLNRRPYFTCRQKMIQHICTLTQYCEATWITRSHTRLAEQRPYVCRARKTPKEVEEARLQRTLTGSLGTCLMPAVDTHTVAKGGTSGTFAKDLFLVMGDGKVPRAPYTTVTRGQQAPAHCAVAPPQGTGTCAQHTRPPYLTCRRFHRTTEPCCSMGHHTPGYVVHLPMLQRCSQHNLPPCPRCMVTKQGICHCCGKGHHKVITPQKPAARARPAENQGPPPKKRRANSQHPHTHTGHTRSPLTLSTPQPSKIEVAGNPPPPKGAWMKTWTPPPPLCCSCRDMEDPALNIPKARGTMRL